jgi:predicted nicotinamide N-methyase
LKRLVMRYVKLLEQNGIAMESNVLSQLVHKVSMGRETLPDANESCYLSFPLAPSSSFYSDSRPRHNTIEKDDDDDWIMRIRVFPFHNNVGLRLWEGGAAMAEFFLEHTSLLMNHHVIELGAGVGLTGLVIAAYCRPSRVYLTDYTDVGRINLQHNLMVNRSWLLRHGISPDQIAQVR